MGAAASVKEDLPELLDLAGVKEALGDDFQPEKHMKLFDSNAADGKITKGKFTELLHKEAKNHSFSQGGNKGSSPVKPGMKASEIYLQSYPATKISDKNSDALCRKFFPKAVVNLDVLDMLTPVMDRLGMNSDNTLFAHSICPDEINHEISDITHVLAQFMGEMFVMGGLAGVPFCGRTGFSAFSHHAPLDGNVFILYAPHVGIASESGQVGFVIREGHSCQSTACGAAIGAYNQCVADPTAGGPELSEDDFQMDFVRREIKKSLDSIQSNPEPMAQLAHVVFDVVDKALHRIIGFKWAENFSSGGKMLLLGGIQINMDGKYTDYFLPLKLELQEKLPSGEVKVTDLLGELPL